MPDRDVSAVPLGCMSFGAPGRGGETWSLGADAGRAIVKQALNGGINLLDTARSCATRR
ncbi:hypothetical protein GCM10010329_50970 [Streptomyces spiroverticillatus]|uniref:NADP-dependent oxidoreductase domain-containing protein n=1 Tax=Streptomyces finlayi TaxID=67296 RepID=A0A918X285_9ACTN|nr:hypothetical protein [Streptomyces finlayi]GHA21480.1 hypothetical protein GCM10010329_50970 [Streptomyces spiroverticillatus]GHD03853.1 hypothetical protein GCM10010334_51920 [Streptomyces finlayi]